MNIRVRDGLRDLVVEVDPSAGPVTYTWRVDDAVSPIRADRVPASELWPGQRWSVEVAASSGLLGSASVTIPEPPGGNVLVLILDDVGVDKLAVYEPANPAVATPNIDALAAEGVLFQSAYASPMCSASRSNLLTGRYGRRTGIGSVLNESTGSLPYEEVIAPEVLHLGRSGATWSSAALGKWNLSTQGTGPDHPNLSGFDYFSGITTVMSPIAWPGNDYFYWAEVTNGQEIGWSTVYNTTDIANDAVERLGALEEPFFLYVALNAAHDPLHVPPPNLINVQVGESSPPAELHAAMLQAADTEIGRMLAAIPPDVRARTTIFFTADNGTQHEAVEAPYLTNRSKRSVYEGGIHVPLIVTGPHVAVPGSRSSALVQLVDVFATVTDIAGAPIVDRTAGGHALVLEDGTQRIIDGLSLLPYLRDPSAPSARAELYSEVFMPNGAPPYDWEMTAIQTFESKLVRELGEPELFRMVPGAIDEGEDLLLDGISADEQVTLTELSARLDAWSNELVYEAAWSE